VFFPDVFPDAFRCFPRRFSFVFPDVFPDVFVRFPVVPVLFSSGLRYIYRNIAPKAFRDPFSYKPGFGIWQEFVGLGQRNLLPKRPDRNASLWQDGVSHW
jgi:hypothetical protein